MKFSGQKFFIILGLFLIPFLFVGALLREPVVNQGLLKITLSILKKRLGSNLKAQTWKIDISKFAVAIEGIEVERNKVKVSVDEFRAEFSPLFLVIGRVQLSKVWVNGVRVEGTFKIPESSEKEPFHLEKKLNLFADKVVDIQNLMNKRKVDFDNVELSNVSLNSNIVNFKRGDIVLENIGPGHVKLEFAFENLTGNTLVPPINRVVASAVILKDLNRAYLSLRRFNVDLDLKEKLHTTLELRGRIPGEFSVDFSSNLAGLSKWVSSLKTTWSESLKSSLKDIHGDIELRGSGSVEGEGLKSARVEMRSKNLKWGDSHFEKLNGEIEKTKDKIVFHKMSGSFWGTRFDKNRKNSFESELLTIENNQLEGVIQTKDLGLCSLLMGLGVHECFVDLAMNGKIKLKGTLDPFLLASSLDIKVTPFEVYSDPETNVAKAEGRLLKTKASTITAQLEIKAQGLDIKEAQIAFSDKTKFTTKGSINFKPSRVYLKVLNDSAELSDILEDFLSFPQKGLMKADIIIDYDFERSKELGRTDVFVNYLIRGLQVDFLPLGDVTGKAQYVKKILDFSPLLRMGPGNLKINGQLGKLRGLDQESELSLWVEAEDYEILVPREKESPIFDAVFNFKTLIRGSLDKNSANPFGGFIKGNFNAATSFGIPFEKGTLDAFVNLDGLKINDLFAYKGEAKTTLRGFLGSQKSRIDFTSQYSPIRQIGYNPTYEKIFQNGQLRASGWWDQKAGFQIDTQSRGLRVGQTEFPIVDVSFGGSDKTGSNIVVQGGEVISFNYDTLNKNLRGNLKDDGILLAFTLFNQWEQTPDFLKAKGSLDVDWTPQRGKIHFQSLDIQVSDRWSKEENRLLYLVKESDIEYKNGTFSGDVDFLSGLGKFELRSAGSELNANGTLLLKVVDLFLPESFRLMDGAADLKAQWNPQKNTLFANAKIEKGTAFLPFIGTEISDLKGDLRVQNEKLYFDSLNGVSNEGRVAVKGSMGLGLYDIDLDLDLQKLPMRFGRDVDITATGALTFTGKSQPFLLRGNLRMDKGLLRKEFNEDSVKTSFLEKPIVNFDVPFQLSPQFQVKNLLTDSYVSGQGRLTGTDLVPVISGRFEVAKGTLLARDNEFNLLFAKVELPEDSSITPVNVNVQAWTPKNYQGIDYRIYLFAEGDPQDLRLNFRSEPSLSQRELISLLSLGYVPKEQVTTSSQGSTLAQSASAEAFQLLFGQALGRGIQKQTGFDVRVGTSANLKQEDTIPKVTVYKRLSDRVSATFGRSLDVSRPENNFKVDYRLLNNLNLTGVWENPEENRHSLGLDLRLEFEIK